MSELLDRFLRYVKVETTAVEQTDEYPSSPGQWELARVLAEELRAIGAVDVSISDRAIVTGTVPATAAGAPTIAWFAHMDTSPEYTASNVKPIVHENYSGKDIKLPGDPDKVIRVDDAPQLANLAGRTIITTDGTTLLGADDKAGIAVVMTAAKRLLAAKGIQHAAIRVVFTCDEEVGRGVDHVELDKVDAIVGYTLDGEGHGIIENETFSADLAVVTIGGRNIHPGLATGRMINAIRLAGSFISRLPQDRLSPETTSGREGFIHPYVIDGGVDRTTIRLLLRSFVTSELSEQASLLRSIATSLESEHSGATVGIEIKRQYRNMAESTAKEPRAVALAKQAMKAAGLEPRLESIRGGTDGSRLSEMGLPTPNLSTGMHNFHSPLEFACLEEMETAVNVLVELAKLWGKERT